MILTNEAAREYINRTRHFKANEFECKCGCGELKTDTRLIDTLGDLREKLGEPLIINSGYRCEKHNEAEGGAKNSQHVKGRAADVRTTPLRKNDIIRLARELRFTGIGVNYQTFVHVDVRDGRPAEF